MSPAGPSGTGPRCRHCGSGRLRRPRSRNPWERFLRARTRWDRYACPDCGDRGWVRQPVPEGSDPLEAPAPAPTPVSAGRPLEVRDQRAARRSNLQTLVAIAAALAMGALAALFLQRCGGAAALHE